MNPIALFHHSLFYLGDPPVLLPNAPTVVKYQMETARASGLLNAAAEIHCGVNGGKESELLAQELLPANANITYHGLQSRSENLTVVMLEKWVQSHPNWYVLYFHCKSATHDPKSEYGQFATRWLNRMMLHCVTNWRQCVADLDAGYEAVGCHWITDQGWDNSQHYFAGTFFWVKAWFFSSIPSMLTRKRIRESGIGALESRYEAEVKIGNGPRIPKVKNYYDGPIGT